MSNLDALRAAIAATQNQPSTAPQPDPKMDPKSDPPHPAVRLILPLDKMALVLSLVLTVGTVALVAESQAPKPERAIASRVDHHFASARLQAGLVRPRDMAIAAFPALPVLNLNDLDLPTLARAAGPWIGWATFSLLFIRGMHRAHRPTETD